MKSRQTKGTQKKARPQERMQLPNGTLARRLTTSEIAEFRAGVERAMLLKDKP